MGDTRESFESSLDRGLSEGERRIRATCRLVFREMVKDALAEGPLGYRKRRAFLSYAAKLNIDPFEARLLIRGAEYECGYAAPAAMENPRSAIEAEYLAALEGPQRLLDRMMLVPAFAAALLMLVWILTRSSG